VLALFPKTRWDREEQERIKHKLAMLQSIPGLLSPTPSLAPEKAPDKTPPPSGVPSAPPPPPAAKKESPPTGKEKNRALASAPKKAPAPAPKEHEAKAPPKAPAPKLAAPAPKDPAPSAPSKQSAPTTSGKGTWSLGGLTLPGPPPGYPPDPTPPPSSTPAPAPAPSVSAALGRRVALVIGNAAYKIGPLQNPVNDAEAMAKALEKDLKFDKVILRKDVTGQSFRAALREFGREVVGAGLALVYYAGHGTEVGGKNFLIPVDAQLAKVADLELEAIALNAVVAQMAGVKTVKLVILDACRNNMFALAGAQRKGRGQGLARVDTDESTLVFYAAKDGTTADDGLGGKHSPFTESLLKHIATPGLELRFLLGEVRDDVMAATGRQQQPHWYGSFGRTRIFLRQ
jgi:hypothetical protein